MCFSLKITRSNQGFRSRVKKMLVATYFLILFLISAVYSDEFSNEGTLYFRSLMRKFAKYRQIIHTDNQLKHQVNSVLKTSKRPLMIFNHESDEEISRPGYGTFINVVVLKNFNNFVEYLSNPKNIFSGDILIVLTESKKYVPENEYLFWNLPYSNRFGNVLIINFLGEYIHVFNVCYYCGYLSGRMNHLESVLKIKDTKAKIPRKMLIGRPFTNFFGETFKVKTVLYFPLIWSYVKSPDNTTTFFGAHKKLLNVLSEKMNFSFTLEQSSGYAELLQDLEEEKVDFSIGGVKLTANRKKALPYIQPLRTEEIHLIFKYRTSINDKMFLLFFTFGHFVWLILFFILLISVVLSFMYLRNFETGGKIFKSIEVVLKPLVEQSTNYTYFKLRFYCFILLTSWWIFCIQLDTAFKAKLASLLIQPPEDNLRNIKELYNYGYDIITNLDGDSDLMSLLESMRIADSRIVTKPDLCSSFKYLKENKAALIGTYADIIYHVQILCNRDNFFEKGMRITNSPIALSEHGWIFKTGAPYSIGFHQIVGRLQAGGFILKWERDIVYNYQRKIAIRKLKSLNQVGNFRPYFSQFSIYGIGIVFSILCFIGEIIYNKLRPVIYLTYYIN